MPQLDFQQHLFQGLINIQQALQHSATHGHNDYQAVYWAGIRYEMREMMQCIGAAHLAGIPLTIPQAIRDLAVALQADGVATLGTLVDIVGQPPDVTDGEAWTGWWDDLEREPITFPDHNYLETVERNHYIRNLLFLNQIQSSMLNDVCSMLQEDASLLLSSAAADIQASLMASFENYRGLLDSIHVVPS